MLLGLLLVELWLMASLFVDRGRVVVGADDVPAMREMIAVPEKPKDDEAAEQNEMDTEVKDSGIFPSVWRSRSCPCGKLLLAAYKNVSSLQKNSTALAFLAFLTAVTGCLSAIFYSRGRTHAIGGAVEIVRAQRQAVHRQALRLGPSEIRSEHNGEIQTLFASEMDDLQEGSRAAILRLTRDPFKLVLLLILALAAAPFVAIVIILLLSGCWLLIAWQRQQGKGDRILGKSRSEEKLRLLSESLRTTRLVRGYGKEMEAFEDEQFRLHLSRLSEETTRWMGQDWVQRWGLAAVSAFVGSIVLLVVGHQLLDESASLSLPSAMLLLGTVACMHAPMRNLWNLKRDVQSAGQVALRIERYLSQMPPVGQAVGAKFLQPMSKSLVFDNVVCAGAGNRRLLDGCSFQVKAGTQVAVVSTDPWEARGVAYMLPRFIEPSSGKILIDGNDIAWVTLESLRAEAIFVSTRDPFFTGSILQNICCGATHYTLQDATEAAKLTHAHNFIAKLPQGYETVVGEHGEPLDAGQSFRLGLARAILRDPAILIIEEPEDTLDEGAKSLLDDAFNRIAQGGRTVIYLPRRMSTLRRVDEIVLLHKGKVEAIGNHAALVRSSPLYCHWEYLNFNTFRHDFRGVGSELSEKK